MSMKKIIKAILCRIGYEDWVLSYPFSTGGGYLYDKGWFESFKTRQSVDAKGNPLIWITYPAIAFLENRINSNMVVFEYGSGASSEWWSSRVAQVVSCEHDENWHLAVKQKLQNVGNITLIHEELVSGGKYCQKIAQYDKVFDVIVIDGRDRVNCTKNSLGALKEDGVILFDNSDREKYTEAYEYLKENGFKELEFWGMCPIAYFESKTSIWYKDKNCLNL